jgi:DNA-binding Lrp family transcriptional regulator
VKGFDGIEPAIDPAMNVGIQANGGAHMSVKAFILIDTSPGKAKEVAQKLRHVAGVSAAHAVTGPHDIIVMAEAADVSALGELVVQRVQSVTGVSRSVTSIVAD